MGEARSIREGGVLVADLPVEILDAIAAGSGCGLVVLDAEDRIAYWSPQFVELTGLDAVQVVGRAWDGLMLPAGIVETPEGDGSRLLAAHEALPGIVFRPVAGGDGWRIGVLRLTSVVPDGEGSASPEVMVSETETGIPNRKFLLGQLQRLLAYQKRYQAVFSLLLIRLENCRSFIEVLGGEEWSLAHRALYDQLSAYVRMSDSVGFYDDDIFWVVLTSSAGDGTRVVADKLRRLVGTMQVSGFADCLEARVSGATAHVDESPEALLGRVLRGLEKAGEAEDGVFLVE